MKLIGAGFLLLLLGFLVVFLTVLGALDQNFLLLFLAYAASLAGLCSGLVGATSLW